MSAEQESDASAAASQIAAAIASTTRECQLLGPAPAPLARLRGRHRQQLLIRGDEDAVRRAALAAQGAATRLRHGVQAVVDVRPWSML